MDSDQESGANGASGRRFPAARLRRPEAGPSIGADGEPEYDPAPTPTRSPFAARSFAGGRVRVFGCSPAWLLLSLVASVVLTVVLNLLIGLF